MPLHEVYYISVITTLSSNTHRIIIPPQIRPLGLFAIRKSGFKDYPAIPKELDLVEREDQITFEIGLDEEVHYRAD